MKQENNMKAGIWNIFSGAIKIQLSDEKHILRNAVIQIVVATICFLMLIRVFPLNEVKHHYYSKQQAIKGYEADVNNPEVDSFGINDKKLQAVQFKRAFVHKITLYMDCIIDRDYRPEDAETMMLWDTNTNLDINEESTCTFRVYDESFSCIYSGDYNCKRISEKGKLVATCDIEVDTEKTYYYEILASESPAVKTFLPVAEIGALEQQENSTLFIDGIINNDYCLIADFEYIKNLNVFEQLIMILCVIVAFCAIYMIAIIFVNCMDKNYSHLYAEIGSKCKMLLSILIAIAGALIITYLVFLNKFGGAIADRLVYFIGSMMLVIIAEILVNKKVLCIDKYRSLISYEYDEKMTIISVWEKYIQTVCFGLLFYSLCQYVNAVREYQHQANLRWMLIYLAIALLMIVGIKKIVNKISVICLGLVIIGSAIYCKEFKSDEIALTLSRLACGVICTWSILIINLIIIKVNKIINKDNNVKKDYKINIFRCVYCMLYLAFLILMIVYRFEKVWVFAASVPFFVILLMDLSDRDRQKLLSAFTNGIILSFVFFGVYCLKYRPYNKWLLYRYGGMFHTVACTGMYFAIVIGVILGKMFGRYSQASDGKKESFRNILFCNFYEIVLTGIAMGFVVVTMSRTAFMTIFVIGFSLVILSWITFKKKFDKVIKEICILAVSVILCFPLTYSAIRIIPAVVNEPVYFDFENNAVGSIVIEGTPVDSSRYMSVERLFEVLFGRFLGDQVSNKENDINIMPDKAEYLAYEGNQLPIEFTFADNSEDDYTEDAESNVENLNADVSNGRFHIFAEFFNRIELKGHGGTSIIDSEGNDLCHAHNSYLQVAYDFGSIAGVIFILICLFSLVSGIVLFSTKGKMYDYYLIPFVMTLAFMIVSFTEWAFHPGIPVGFCFLFVQPLLIRK